MRILMLNDWGTTLFDIAEGFFLQLFHVKTCELLKPFLSFLKIKMTKFIPLNQQTMQYSSQVQYLLLFIIIIRFYYLETFFLLRFFHVIKWLNEVHNRMNIREQIS